jgi:hypothetical protein
LKGRHLIGHAIFASYRYQDILAGGQGNDEDLKSRTVSPYFLAISEIEGAIVEWTDNRTPTKQPVSEWTVAMRAIGLRREDLTRVGAKHRDLLFSDDKVTAFAGWYLIDGSDRYGR